MAVAAPTIRAPGAQSNDIQWSIGEAQGKVASISAIIAMIANADSEKQDLLAALAGVELLIEDVADTLEMLAGAARTSAS